MTSDQMDALRFAIDHQPPKKGGWWKRTGILVGILIYLVTALVAFVVAIIAAALAIFPVLTLVAMGWYLKVGSDRMRKLLPQDNTKNLPPDFVARVTGDRVMGLGVTTLYLGDVQIACPWSPTVTKDAWRCWGAIVSDGYSDPEVARREHPIAVTPVVWDCVKWLAANETVQKLGARAPATPWTIPDGRPYQRAASGGEAPQN